MTRVVMLDVTFFGRMKSGPFFALLVKTDGGSKRQDPPYVQRGT
jgi:hypothetical protein